MHKLVACRYTPLPFELLLLLLLLNMAISEYNDGLSVLCSASMDYPPSRPVFFRFSSRIYTPVDVTLQNTTEKGKAKLQFNITQCSSCRRRRRRRRCRIFEFAPGGVE